MYVHGLVCPWFSDKVLGHIPCRCVCVLSTDDIYVFENLFLAFTNYFLGFFSPNSCLPFSLLTNAKLPCPPWFHYYHLSPLSPPQLLSYTLLWPPRNHTFVSEGCYACVLLLWPLIISCQIPHWESPFFWAIKPLTSLQQSWFHESHLRGRQSVHTNKACFS